MEIFKLIAIKGSEVREHYGNDPEIYKLYDFYCSFQGKNTYDYVAIYYISTSVPFVVAQTVNVQSFANVIRN